MAENKASHEAETSDLSKSDHILQGKDVKGTALLAKACDILDLVGAAPGQMTAKELAQKAALPQSTVYRIVAALSARGFLRTSQTSSKLLLGFHFLDLAQNVWAEQDLATIAAEELRRLKEITGETTYLGGLMGHEMVSLARSLGTHANSSTSDLGETKPVHCTSQGKALLAFLPSQQLDHLLSSLALEPYTNHTITDKYALKLSLNIIRQRGFAVDDQEYVKGTRCIGVPILDANGNAVAAISVSGPTYRMTKERMEQLAPEIIETGKAISHLVQNHKSKMEHSSKVEVTAVGEALFYGDKPFWLKQEGCMYWVDRLAPTVYAMKPGEEPRKIAILPGPIDEVVPGLIGGIDIVCEGRWYHAQLHEGCHEIQRFYAREFHSFCTDIHGTLWACRKQKGHTKIGILSEFGDFAMHWSVSLDIDAMAWNHSGTILHALSRDNGLIYQMRKGREAALVLSKIPKGSGNPCALAMDKDNNVWVALKDGWGTARLSDTGEVEGVLPLPVPHPTGLTFGGPDGDDLYITCARLGVGRDVILNAKLSGFTLRVRMSPKDEP
nr:IclR family transcriptional regulator C-terminal domain-containing protein [uncultured Cohaesibacter sp.]